MREVLDAAWDPHLAQIKVMELLEDFRRRFGPVLELCVLHHAVEEVQARLQVHIEWLEPLLAAFHAGAP